jgi:IS5 family transposase
MPGSHAAAKPPHSRSQLVSRISSGGDDAEKKCASPRKGNDWLQVLTNLFRHRKTRYRGLAKNTAQMFSLFAFANPLLAGRRFSLPNTPHPSFQSSQYQSLDRRT